MIIVLRQDVSPREIKNLEDWLRARDTVTTVIRGEERSVIAVIGAIRFSGDELENHPAVLEVLRVSKPYKIASRESGLAARIRIGDCLVGGPKFIVMAGPCAVENRETLLESASKLSEMGVTVLRGGAFKPRTSPYSFQGLGEEGLKILAEARELTGMKVVTEVMTADKVDLVARYADILQVGARNMQNFDLLKAVAEVDKPVILKRGMAATIDEWLMGAEYILGRNQKVILCERGIRTFETKTRNTLDLNAVPVLKELTHLPVIVDPSHGTGVRRYVLPMSLASMGAGADGLLVEVHPEPERALSDGAQSLTFPELERLLKALQSMAPVVGRELELTWRHPEVTTSASPPKVQVAYQGEPGAFSEMAALAFFGEIQPAGYPAFRDVFEKVASGEAAYGVIPIENSLAGSINQSYDLLLELDVAIVGELKLRVSHNLLSNRGVRKEDIRKLYGHPQALAQCDRFLRQHSDWTVFQTYDTAGSVKLIKDEGAVDTAAIASLRAASIYDVDILAEAIEDNPQNYTRFVIIAKEARVHEKCDKTSVVFTTPNEPGALFEVLKLAAECQVNLVKLESRPIQGRPWEYMFYMDFEGNIEAPTVGRLVRSLPDCTERLKVLGCYPAA
jgi:3-deoxy-7-phosphoheptulonate synthase